MIKKHAGVTQADKEHAGATHANKKHPAVPTADKKHPGVPKAVKPEHCMDKVAYELVKSLKGLTAEGISKKRRSYIDSKYKRVYNMAFRHENKPEAQARSAAQKARKKAGEYWDSHVDGSGVF